VKFVLSSADRAPRCPITGHRCLLRRRHHRPRRRASQPGDELRPSHHWITSSAVASSVSGMLRPSAVAVLRLTTSSIFVDRCTGRFAASRHAEHGRCRPRLGELGRAEIANEIANISQRLQHLAAVMLNNANFQQNGQTPKDETRGRHADLERGPRPPGLPRKD
jgi:hypothetical protein